MHIYLQTHLPLHRLKFISFSLFYGSFEARNKKYQECRRLMLLLAKVPQTGQFEPSAKLPKALLLFTMSVQRANFYLSVWGPLVCFTPLLLSHPDIYS